jgi:hypothetical protein
VSLRVVVRSSAETDMIESAMFIAEDDQHVGVVESDRAAR